MRARVVGLLGLVALAVMVVALEGALTPLMRTIPAADEATRSLPPPSSAPANPTLSSTGAIPSSSPEPTEPPDIAHLRYRTMEPSDIQRQIDEGESRGLFRLPLPDIVALPNISLHVIHSIPSAEIAARLGIALPSAYRGQESSAKLALVGAAPGQYELPAVERGRVIEQGVNRSSTFSTITVISPHGYAYGYVVPSPAMSPLAVGDFVQVGQPLVSFTFAPDTAGGKAFLTFLQTQWYDAPVNAFAIISVGEAKGATLLAKDLTPSTLLSTSDGLHRYSRPDTLSSGSAIWFLPRGS